MRLAVVIPVKNRAALLSRCLTALMTAVQDATAVGHVVQVIVADNDSRDDTVSIARQHPLPVHLVHSTAACVGGVRNDGAHAAIGDATSPVDVLVFLDADCLVPPDFLRGCVDVLTHSGADAVGCEVCAPTDGHWTERAWDALHRPGGDGPRHYINSACFAIRREAFVILDGFDATRPSSEDVDICQRLVARGGRLFQSERLAVLHLGNPQSLGAFWRRVVWHNEGVFDAAGRMQRAPMVYATLGHGVVLAVSAGLAAWRIAASPWQAIGILLAGPLVVPVAFVVARQRQFRRRIPLLPSTALMALTFPARLHGMWRGWVRRPMPSRLTASS